jgi:hypothetical protein
MNMYFLAERNVGSQCGKVGQLQWRKRILGRFTKYFSLSIYKPFCSKAFRVCRRSCGFCEPTLYKLKPARNCTKGSGVNPTIKDPKAGTEVDVKTGEKLKGGKKEKTDQGKGPPTTYTWYFK